MSVTAEAEREETREIRRRLEEINKDNELVSNFQRRQILQIKRRDARVLEPQLKVARREELQPMLADLEN